MARDRNPDEYAIDMAHAQKNEKTGVTLVEKLPMPKLLPHEEIDLDVRKDKIEKARKPTSKEKKKFVRQNAMGNLNILRTKLTMETKKAEKLKKHLSFISGANVGANNDKNQHVIFVESKEALESFDPSKFFDTDPELAANVHNRPRKKTLLEHKAEKVNPAVFENKAMEAYSKLEKCMDRIKMLQKAIQDVEMALAMATREDEIEHVVKDKNVTNLCLGGENKHVALVKFKNERKK